MKNFDLLSMPKKQYANDKNQVEKPMFQQLLTAMYDLYTKGEAIVKTNTERKMQTFVCMRPVNNNAPNIIIVEPIMKRTTAKIMA